MSNKTYETIGSQKQPNPFLHSPRPSLSQFEILDALAKFTPTPALIANEGIIVFANSALVALVGAPDSRKLVGKSLADFLQNHQLSRWGGGSVAVAVEERSFEFFGGTAQFLSLQPIPSTADPDLYAQMAVPVCFTDTKGKILRWNPHFSALVVGDSPILAGMHFRDICPEVHAQLEPLLAQVLRTGEGLTGMEVRRTRPFTLGLECDLLVAMEPVRAAAGGVIGVNTAFHGITELKAIEREHELVFRALGDSLDFGIWICDAEGLNTYTSESFCRLVGLSQEQCAGFGWTQAMNPDRAALTLAAWQECVAQGRNWTAEAWFKTAEKCWQPVLMRGVPVRDAAGKTLCWAGIILDIGTFMAAREELEDANHNLARTNEELEEFACTAGHDLQEPLRVIRMMTSLMMKRYAETLDDDAQSYLATTEESAARMANLVQDLLEYARVIQPPITPHQVSDLNESAAIAIQSCQASIEESSAVVEYDPLPSLTADAGQIARVFQNLISNAIKYRRAEAPQIRISADPRGQEWRFCVADNGQGIADDRQASIFMPFKRLHSQNVPGSGLGLAVCKKIVEQHGGCIWVESQPGEGSHFYFTLPAD